MSKVFEVDPAVIARTQAWLARCQEADGSYKPAQGGIQEGAINAFTDNVLRSTAYITWALAHTGYGGPEVEKGLQYIRSHLSDLKDPFTLAIAANALVTADSKAEATLKVLQMLFEKRTEEKDLVFWKSQSETPTCGRGESADIEVTGLAVQAFVQAGRELGAVGKAVTYLARSKDAEGTWHSTQATIQALRAMLMAERGATRKSKARIALRMNGKDVKTLMIDESNSDVLQLVDLKDLTQAGENRVDIAFAGEGSLMYQVVGRYYVPQARETEARPEPMTIALSYDRTQLATDDILKVMATVTCNRPGRAKMVIVDLGLPPGFMLIPDELNKLVEKKVLQKYNVTGRQIIVYLEELESGKPVSISYGLQAKYPLKAKTPKSVVYEYYNPQARGEQAPMELTVASK
jgi:alpha-2-macroglobulin-like protein